MLLQLSWSNFFQKDLRFRNSAPPRPGLARVVYGSQISDLNCTGEFTEKKLTNSEFKLKELEIGATHKTNKINLLTKRPLSLAGNIS